MPIPKTIVQTGKTPASEPPSSAWCRANPDYEYRYFDDRACAAFLRNHFGPRAVRAFWRLRPGAFKADLFRYAYLFVHGGVYIDLDCMPVAGVPLERLLESGADCVAAGERRGIPGVWQAFLACRPGVPALRAAVQRICLHTERRWYPETGAAGEDRWTGVLSITGPVLLAGVLGGVHTPGCHLVEGTSVFLHRLGAGPSCPVLSGEGEVLMHGTTPAHIRSKERYDALVAQRAAYWD